MALYSHIWLPLQKGVKKGSKRGPNLTPFWTPPERTLQITPWKMRDLAQNSSKPVPEGVPKGVQKGSFWTPPGTPPERTLQITYRKMPDLAQDSSKRVPEGVQKGSKWVILDPFWDPLLSGGARLTPSVCRIWPRRGQKGVKKGVPEWPLGGVLGPPQTPDPLIGCGLLSISSVILEGLGPWEGSKMTHFGGTPF